MARYLRRPLESIQMLFNGSVLQSPAEQYSTQLISQQRTGQECFSSLPKETQDEETLIYEAGVIYDRQVRCLFDSGANDNSIDRHTAKLLGWQETPGMIYGRSVLANGQFAPIYDVWRIRLEVLGVTHVGEFLILDLDDNDDVVLGLSFWRQWRIQMDYEDMRVFIPEV
jgi:hypothetical protein